MADHWAETLTVKANSNLVNQVLTDFDISYKIVS
jgi:hypothetical protein